MHSEDDLAHKGEKKSKMHNKQDLPALRVLVVALAGSRFLARSRLVSSRPSLSSGITIVAFSLNKNTNTRNSEQMTLNKIHFTRLTGEKQL